MLTLSISLAITVLGVSVYMDHGTGVNYEEFFCPSNNKSCQELLCPIGWSWSLDDGKCLLLEGYRCCSDSMGMIQCQDEGRDMEDICVVDLLSAGVGWSEDYKKTCRQGYIWVEWKTKCARVY